MILSRVALSYHVYLEDCIVGMQNHVESESIDVIVADPPFGINFDEFGKSPTYERNSDFVIDGYVDIKPENYESFTTAWITQVKRCLKDSGSGYIFSGWSQIATMIGCLNAAKLTIVNHIIWRYQFGVFTKRKYATSHYHILFVVKDERKYKFYKHDENEYIEDVWVFQRPYVKDQERYATKLPPSLVRKCLQHSSVVGDTILDPFLGSGTTMKVAKEMNRNCVGFEVNPNCIELYKPLCIDIVRS